MRFVIFSSGLMLNLENVLYLSKETACVEDHLRVVGAAELILTEQETEKLRQYIEQHGIGNGFTQL